MSSVVKNSNNKRASSGDSPSAVKNNKRVKSTDSKTTRESGIELFGYWRSSCTWRVRICLELKGLRYKYTAVNLLKSEQLTSEYATLNPMKHVPSAKLESGDVIAESSAIIEWMEEKFVDVPLMGGSDDLLTRALIRQVSSLIGSGIQPIQNLKVLKHVFKLTGDDADKKMEWGKHWIQDGFVALEELLTRTSTNSRYCVGDAVSVADAFLVPQVYNARRFKVDMTQFPTISAIEAHLSELDAFKRAHPSQMSDAVQ